MTQALLVEQHEALNEFLDDLLTEDLTQAEKQSEGSDEATLVIAREEMTVDVAEAEQEPVAVSEEEEITETFTSVADNCSSEFIETGRIPVIPDWGLQPFQAMIFKVGELSLALPMTEFASVIEWQATEVPLAGNSELYLGDYLVDGRKVAVIDLGRLIFADSQKVSLEQGQSERIVTRIILIDNGNLALACDSVHEVVTLQPEQICWRSTKTRRQWLAGTMIEEMIVVLDACSLAKIIAGKLVEADRG